MNLKAKSYLESQKKASVEKLGIRMADLKEKGLDLVTINRDRWIKKIRGDIRQANYRLACIAAQEKLNAEKAQAKAEKLAAKDNPPVKPPKKTAKDASAKKEKKEKKKAPPPPADDKG